MRQAVAELRLHCAKYVLGAQVLLASAVLMAVHQPAHSANVAATELVDLSGGAFNGTAFTMISRAPGRPNDLFVSQQNGTIYRVDLTTNTASTFFSIPAADISTGDYWGLLGFTFAPDFATSGNLYAHVADDRSLDNFHHRVYVRKYTLNNPASNTPTLNSMTNLLRWGQGDLSFNTGYGTDHSGGYIGFQPGDNDTLWITSGDTGNREGAERDRLRTGQDPSDLRSGIIRINVNGTGAGEFGTYSIPANNPKATGAPQFSNWAPEMWSIGLRSPWGGSFDRNTGDFMFGDVGASQIGGNTGEEEVDFERAGSPGGRNYGWRIMEGTQCPTSQDAGVVCNEASPDPALTMPVYAYPYGGGYGTGSAPTFAGRSVTGGYVYRGPIEELQGKYIFGDWSSRQIWSLQIDRNGNNGAGSVVSGSLEDLSTEFNRQLTGGAYTPGVTGFGEDEAGNLYFVELDGSLYKIVPAAPVVPTATWNVNAAGDWSLNANWQSTFGTAPNGNTHNVVFGSVITASRTVATNANVTAKSLTFSNANKYAVSGGGTITLAADAGNSSISVTLGSHEIQAALALGSNTDVSAAVGTRLDINNSLNLNGRTLNVSGSGRVFLNSNLETANGVVNNTGNLGGTGRVNGALNNNGGTVLPGASVGTLTVETTFSQNATGALAIEIAGVVAGQADKLAVGGAATLDGTVSVTLLNGYIPAAGSVFTILTAAGIIDNGIEMAGGTSPYYLMAGSGTSLLLGVGIQGDFNQDGTVNAADYTVWRNSLGQSVANGSGADADGSGTVTQADYALWKAHYGQVAITPGSGSGASVPEPGTFGLLLMAMAISVCGAARRSNATCIGR